MSEQPRVTGSEPASTPTAETAAGDTAPGDTAPGDTALGDTALGAPAETAGAEGSGAPAEGSGASAETAPAEGSDVPAGGPTADTPDAAPDGSPDADVPADAADAALPARRPLLARVREAIHLPRSRRGLVALLLIFGAFGAASVFGAITVVAWTETADFCGRCHEMGPELAGYDAGPHREVACAECHVKPGVGGFIEAKINGTRQLIEVITGTFPKPVPPPDHAMLPSYTETCLRCHSMERLVTSGVKTKIQFTEDENNTRQFVGLLIRPGGGDVSNIERSVHWHVRQTVQFVAEDRTGQKIDYVKVSRNDGTTAEFITQDQVRMVDNIAPDLRRVMALGPLRTMDCLDCHNRVGHPIPNPRIGVDSDMAAGTLDPSLPYLKRQSMYLLKGDYPSVEAADTAIASLRDFYSFNYPLVAGAQKAQIDAAVTELQRLYRLTATPAMKVTAATYPDNLGHMDFVGCFRCHDGGHYEIVKGSVAKTAIPSSCDTCHSFPQIGKATASLPYGAPPATHDDSLYVFNHRKVATGIDPGTQSCGECHARDYCANCHDTGAINVKHDDMLLNHAKVARDDGTGACAYCHQPVYCARCHNEPVLPTGGALVPVGPTPTPVPATPAPVSPTPPPVSPTASPPGSAPPGPSAGASAGPTPSSPSPPPNLSGPSPYLPLPSPTASSMLPSASPSASSTPTSFNWILRP